MSSLRSTIASRESDRSVSWYFVNRGEWVASCWTVSQALLMRDQVVTRVLTRGRARSSERSEGEEEQQSTTNDQAGEKRER